MTTMTTANVTCPRFVRTSVGDGASEILTLVRVTDGPLAGQNFASVDLDDAEYPYLVQITAGPAAGDDFVGLYDLDGDAVDPAGCSWEVVTEAPAEVVEQIETCWNRGQNTVERIASPTEDGDFVTKVLAAETRDHNGGEREYRLVDVDDGVTQGRSLHYRDCPPPASGEWTWLYAGSADKAETIDEALAEIAKQR